MNKTWWWKRVKISLKNLLFPKVVNRITEDNTLFSKIHSFVQLIEHRIHAVMTRCSCEMNPKGITITHSHILRTMVRMEDGYEKKVERCQSIDHIFSKTLIECQTQSTIHAIVGFLLSFCSLHMNEDHLVRREWSIFLLLSMIFIWMKRWAENLWSFHFSMNSRWAHNFHVRIHFKRNFSMFKYNDIQFNVCFNFQPSARCSMCILSMLNYIDLKNNR